MREASTRELLRSLVCVGLADEAALDARTRPLDPLLHPLMGANPGWSPAIEGQAEAPLDLRLDGDGKTVRCCSICGGRIKAGDPFYCLGCDRVSPANAAAIRRGTRPRPRKPVRVPRGKIRLTARERAALCRKADGPPCLALCDARDAGDAERASAIEHAFALYRSGLITMAELHRRAGTLPGQDPRRARGRP